MDGGNNYNPSRSNDKGEELGEIKMSSAKTNRVLNFSKLSSRQNKTRNMRKISDIYRKIESSPAKTNQRFPFQQNKTWEKSQ